MRYPITFRKLFLQAQVDEIEARRMSMNPQMVSTEDAGRLAWAKREIKKAIQQEAVS